MRYQFTLLKDLPEYPAGTVFGCYGISYRFDERCKRGPYYEVYGPSKCDGIRLEEVGGVFDNPEWYKREPDFKSLLDLECPVCGETRGLLRRLDKYDMDECGSAVNHGVIEY